MQPRKKAPPEPACEQVATITITIVSTHAPLRGATGQQTKLHCRAGFLLTRLCEARLALLYARTVAINFYSRASARRDKVEPRWALYGRISTHAPLRGATSVFLSICITVSFLLTRLCEARRGFGLLQIRTYQFLLTRLCEARPLHLVPNGSRISIYRKRRTLFRKSTMIKHFSYPNYILFQANLPPFSQHFRFAAATLPAGKSPLALKNNYPL